MNLPNLLTNMKFKFSINIMYNLYENAALLYNEMKDANLNVIQIYLLMRFWKQTLVLICQHNNFEKWNAVQIMLGWIKISLVIL